MFISYVMVSRSLTITLLMREVARLIVTLLSRAGISCLILMLLSLTV